LLRATIDGSFGSAIANASIAIADEATIAKKTFQNCMVREREKYIFVELLGFGLQIG
jgi:hypothetical protein